MSKFKNYNSIDLFKFIASFLIITIHFNPLTSFGDDVSLYFVSTLPRLAVPFFFACSGFFFFKKLTFENGKILNSKDNRKKLYSFILRIGILYLVWSLVYLLWSIPEWNATGWLSLNAFIDYGIAFFRSSSYFHLWYLIDLIYATIVGYLLLSFIKRKYVIVISLILYIAGMLVYSYFWISPYTDILVKISENFPAMWDSITRVLAFTMIGYGTTLIKKPTKQKSSLFLFAVSFVLLIAEMVSLNIFTSNHDKFSYIIFTIPCSYFLFTFIKNLNISIGDRVSKMLRQMSTVIYCTHPLFIGVISLAIPENTINSLLEYIIISCCSVGVSFVIIKQSKIKYFKFLKYIL